VGANDGAIDDGNVFVDFYLELTKDPRPVILRGPVGESVVDRLPRAEALRQIPPRNARLHSKEDRIHEQPVVLRLPPLRSPREQRIEPSPLRITQCVPTHGQVGSRAGLVPNFQTDA